MIQIRPTILNLFAIPLITILSLDSPQAQQNRTLESKLKESHSFSRDITESNIELEYASILNRIKEKKDSFKESYLNSDDLKKNIIEQAKDYVFNSLTSEIFPKWYGTKWEFYGKTKKPKKGSIACGYFVATTLRDSGFNLSISDLAKQPSLYIIKNLISSTPMRNYSNKGVQYTKKKVEESGKGIYIIGLDNHVGFIVNNSKEIRFVHSSYYDPPLSVVSQPIDSFNPIVNSRHIVIGKILDDEMIRKWILGERFQLKFDYFHK